MPDIKAGLTNETLSKLLGRELDLVEAHGLERLLEEYGGRNLEFFYTVGIYNNEDSKSNHVATEHLTNHIAYNLVMRPGRAFFVNGICLNQGYLGAQRCCAHEARLKAAGLPVMRRSTAPYH
jgi:hypothetical protein